METRKADYTSPRGFKTDSVPWRLWEKAKRGVWDPADLDYSRERADWSSFTDRERAYVTFLAGRFMVGEEAVTIDILPLIRAVASEGRLEETMFLTTFASDEARHIEFFRRWFDAVGLGSLGEEEFGPYRGIIHDILPTVMGRLDSDRSSEAILDAAITYNQIIEGVLALTGYQIWDRIIGTRHILPAMHEGLALIQRDERRHIAYGTYLCRRLIAAEPPLWDFAQRRIEQFRAMMGGGGGLTFSDGVFDIEPDLFGKLAMQYFSRRLEVIAVAASMDVADVETGHVEEDLEEDIAAGGMGE